jgi:hypothetical protein
MCEMFMDLRNLRDADQCVAQHRSVPQAGGHCRRRRAALIHRSYACMSKPLLVNHGRKVELASIATVFSVMRSDTRWRSAASSPSHRCSSRKPPSPCRPFYDRQQDRLNSHQPLSDKPGALQGQLT